MERPARHLDLVGGHFDPLSVALFAVTESERRAAASFGIEPDDPRPGVGLRELHGHFGRNDVQHPLFGEVVVFDFYRPERFERSQFFGRGGHGRDVFRAEFESGDPDVLHVGSGRDVRAGDSFVGVEFGGADLRLDREKAFDRLVGPQCPVVVLVERQNDGQVGPQVEFARQRNRRTSSLGNRYFADRNPADVGRLVQVQGDDPVFCVDVGTFAGEALALYRQDVDGYDRIRDVVADTGPQRQRQ